jgi:S1-C subfamily serine protease
MPLIAPARRLLCVVLCLLLPLAVHSAELPATILKVKPSVIGIGSYLRTRSPNISFHSTGFVVGDGLSVITNAHTVTAILDSEHKEQLGIVVKNGSGVDFRPATVVAVDKEHDLAHLRLSGTPLPALTLGDSATVPEGQALALTGFPLGMGLGLNHATHRATLAAITPAVMPAVGDTRKLDARMVARLQRPVATIFQLDGTAFPGNSGSPVYDPETGVVLGVLSGGIIKGLKEAAIASPSGISYAIPINFARELLQQKAP